MTDYNLERLNFLIADDNRHMRALVKGVLLAMGCRSIAEAEDGADAYKRILNFPADMAICDWNMKPLDGLEFAQLVRTAKDSPNPMLPIIMLTGYSDLSRVMTARDAGINEYLIKPISAAGIYSRIRAVILKPRPFVRTKDYFGPSRRRLRSDGYRGMDRRKTSVGAENVACDSGDDDGFDQFCNLPAQ